MPRVGEEATETVSWTAFVHPWCGRGWLSVPWYFQSDDLVLMLCVGLSVYDITRRVGCLRCCPPKFRFMMLPVYFSVDGIKRLVVC